MGDCKSECEKSMQHTNGDGEGKDAMHQSMVRRDRDLSRNNQRQTAKARMGRGTSCYAALAAAAVTFLSLTAQAQDFTLPCAPEVTELRSGLLMNGEQQGMWFHLEVARCMLTRLAVLPELQLQLSLFEEREQATEALGASLRRRGDLAVQEAETAREALTAAVRARRRAEEDLDVWYRHPLFLMAAGAAVVVALEIVAIVIFNEVSP